MKTFFKCTIIVFFLLFLILLANKIAFVKIIEEFGVYYFPFEKKTFNLKFLYYNPIGERDISDLNYIELLDLKEFCDIDKYPIFPCGDVLDLEIKKRDGILK